MALPSHLMVHVASVTLTPYHLMAREAHSAPLYSPPSVARICGGAQGVGDARDLLLAALVGGEVCGALGAAVLGMVHGASVTFAPYHQPPSAGRRCRYTRWCVMRL